MNCPQRTSTASQTNHSERTYAKRHALEYIPDTERCQAFTPVLYNVELQQLLDREERPFDVIMEEWIEKNKEFEPEIRHFNEHYPEIVTNAAVVIHDASTGAMKKLRIEYNKSRKAGI